MSPKAYTLAVETSSRHGSATLGRGGAVVASADLGAQQRHAIALLPAVDTLFHAHGVVPADLAAVFVSHGPGSFTGLRVGVTTAKMLARVTGCSIVAVPTLDVIAENAPPDATRVVVLLNAKSGRWFTGLYERAGDRWRRLLDPSLMTGDEVVAAAGPSVTIIGDFRGDYEWPATANWLDGSLARPRSEVVHRIGQAMLDAGRTVDPIQLTPLYVRLPDAEEVWQARHGAAVR